MRLKFFLDYLWKEKDLWSDPKAKRANVCFIIGNKSLPILKSIMTSIQDQIMSQNQTNFTVNMRYHLGDKKLSKLSWASLEHSEVSTNPEEIFTDLQLKIASEVDEFYSQSDSQLFECNITVNIDNFMLPKTSDAVKDGTIKFSIFGINSPPETIEILSRMTESLVVTNGLGSDKKKAKLGTELSTSEQMKIRDFKSFFEFLITHNPISTSFVDYRFLVEDLEGPMTGEEKNFV
jgi:hypothetical protein